MLEHYIYHGREKLRCGYTTGSCAAAAAKAAVAMLLTGKRAERVELMTPKGILLDLEVRRAEQEAGYASCAIQKDSGDDPDITKGIYIYARAERMPETDADGGYQAQGRVLIDGGAGIGRVTKPGLEQPVGEAAINSTPRRMIEAAVREVMEQYEYGGGMRITIYAPEGAELAKKTFNPRLGIEGGISILGTSGIVEPMSSEALIQTIRMEASVRAREGKKYLFVTLGNYGRSFVAEQMPGLLDKSVRCSNFIGEAIDIGLELEFEGILIAGHIGKLVKLGAGIMNTHSAQADGRMDVLVTCGLLAGVEADVLRRLPACATTDEALAVLQKAGGLAQTMEQLMKRIHVYLRAKVRQEIPIGAILFSNQFGRLGETEDAGLLLERVMEEYHD